MISLVKFARKLYNIMNDDTLDVEFELGDNTVERFKGAFWSIFARTMINESQNPVQLIRISNEIEEIFRNASKEDEVSGAYQDALNEFLSEVRAEISQIES